MRAVEPSVFENIVARLLEKLDYGSMTEGSIEVTGRSGDEGVDGICSMDVLGLLKVLFQAKRWSKDNLVTPHDIRDFIGAIHNKRANYGVFITTSDFTKQAIEEVEKAGNIRVINGKELALLAIKTGLGVKKSSINYPRLDEDFFAGLG